MIRDAAFDVLVGLIVAGAAVIAVRAWRFHRRDLRELMDDGDGQGGVPSLPRRTRPLSLGDLVQVPARAAAIPGDPDPALGCRYCGLPFDPRADCECTGPCGDRDCGWLQWLAITRTGEMEAEW